VDSQVLELLSAFGAVKAFNLVKNDPMSDTSKGYCFVEYCDPNVTQIAAMGLNGMDMGGGKVLSARLSSQHGQETEGGEFGAPVAAPPVDASVVDGVDVNALLQAALGGGGAMPAAAPVAIQQPYQQPIVVKDPMAVANAAASALDQAFGSGGVPPLAPPTAMPGSTVTRILVLLNMVMDEDLATAEDRKFLEEEVREEVGKYGTLLSMKIPMPHVRHCCYFLCCIFKCSMQFLSYSLTFSLCTGGMCSKCREEDLSRVCDTCRSNVRREGVEGACVWTQCC
jgi:splicing factor U2AF subunit